MGADRLDADVQRLGDLGVGASVRKQLHHLGLARGQQVGARRYDSPDDPPGGDRRRDRVGNAQ